jgi:hypothetical protein
MIVFNKYRFALCNLGEYFNQSKEAFKIISKDYFLGGLQKPH